MVMKLIIYLLLLRALCSHSVTEELNSAWITRWELFYFQEKRESNGNTWYHTSYDYMYFL